MGSIQDIRGQLRQNKPLRNGSGTTQRPCAQHVAVHHTNNDSMANRSYDNYGIGFSPAAQWNVRFNSDSVGCDPGFGNRVFENVVIRRDNTDGMPRTGELPIKSHTAIILSQDE